MTRLSPAPLVQVMLFRDVDNLTDFGRAVWSALAETAAFYRRANVVRSYERFLFHKGYSGDPLRTELPESPEDISRSSQSEIWTALQSIHPRVYDQERMVGMVRGILGSQRDDARLLICTDERIMPPEGWRYILWDGVGDDVVVSTAPMDSLYWGTKKRNRRPGEGVRQRAAYVKHRARAAMLSGTGEQLGLERCDNPGCFLYANVDSVSCLDSMAVLGKEHEEDVLTDWGFAWTDSEPENEQAVTFRPAPPPEGGLYA
jgi:hypothetical protein